MKRTILTLLALLPMLAFGQSFKEDPNFIKDAPNAKSFMIDTIGSSDLSKSQLYSNALSYLTNNFKDARSVIESKDLELGEISFKGNTYKIINVSDTSKKGKVTVHQEYVRLYFKCKIYLKDKKFKIVLNSLQKPFSEIIAPDILININPFTKDLLFKSDLVASDLAMNLIKNIAKFLNKKPDNDF